MIIDLGDGDTVAVRDGWLADLVERTSVAVSESIGMRPDTAAYAAAMGRADAWCGALGAVLGLPWTVVREAWEDVSGGLSFAGALDVAQRRAGMRITDRGNGHG